MNSLIASSNLQPATIVEKLDIQDLFVIRYYRLTVHHQCHHLDHHLDHHLHAVQILVIHIVRPTHCIHLRTLKLYLTLFHQRKLSTKNLKNTLRGVPGPGPTRAWALASKIQQ